VDAGSDLDACFAIRRAVFVDEQGIDHDLEFDGSDVAAIGLLALMGETPVGTARLMITGGSARLGRVAVLRDYRGMGVGRLLVRCAMATAIEYGASEVVLHSQTSVVDFYERLGFWVEGPEFLEAGIPHKAMKLSFDVAEEAHDA